MMLLLFSPLLFNLNLVECHSFPKINIFSGSALREKTFQIRNIFSLFPATIGSHCSRPCFPYLARLDFLAISRRSPTNHGTTNVLVRKVSAHTPHPTQSAHCTHKLHKPHSTHNPLPATQTLHRTNTHCILHTPYTVHTTQTMHSIHTLHSPYTLWTT